MHQVWRITAWFLVQRGRPMSKCLGRCRVRFAIKAVRDSSWPTTKRQARCVISGRAWAKLKKRAGRFLKKVGFVQVLAGLSILLCTRYSYYHNICCGFDKLHIAIPTCLRQGQVMHCSCTWEAARRELTFCRTRAPCGGSVSPADAKIR